MANRTSALGVSAGIFQVGSYPGRRFRQPLGALDIDAGHEYHRVIEFPYGLLIAELRLPGKKQAALLLSFHERQVDDPGFQLACPFQFCHQSSNSRMRSCLTSPALTISRGGAPEKLIGIPKNIIFY